MKKNPLTQVTQAVVFAVAYLIMTGCLLAQNQKVENLGRQIVPKIEAKVNGGTRIGAGIIVGRANGRLYVATANHVVRDDQPATSVTVTFGNLPGEQFSANVLTPLTTTALDLAVIAIPDNKLPRDFFPTKILISPATMKRGAEVYPVGHPDGRAWDVPIVPDHLDTVVGDTVNFQSNFVVPGHSGGALMDENGNILGMITETQRPGAVAISIDTVITALKTANYPVQLTKGDTSLQPPPPVTIGLPPTPSKERVERPTPTPTTGTINLRYTGDFAQCSLNLQIKIGNKNVHPTSNFYPVNDVALGPAKYTITGGIGCPALGFCTVNGGGDIDVANNATYDVAWLSTGYAVCAATLIKSPF